MKRFILGALVLAVPSATHAGDYWLTVANDATAACVPRRASRENASWPVRTASEIGRDIERYFSGKKPSLGLFEAAFGNGRISFCGSNERMRVDKAIAAVSLHEKIHHERQLMDVAMMLGSKDLVASIDRLLAGATPEGAARLKRMKASAERGMRLRGKVP